LLFEKFENRAVLRGAELFLSQRTCCKGRASLQHLRRPEQTTNVFSAKGSGHDESFPHLKEAENFQQLFEKQRNSIGRKTERQGSSFAYGSI
jgi:hypothetical protein